MENIELKEQKLKKLKKRKYKSAYNKKLLLNSLKKGITFAIIMIILRCLALWVLSLQSEITYKELIMSRYYYGNGKGKVFDYVVNNLDILMGFLYPKSLLIVTESGGGGYLDWCLVGFCYIHIFLFVISLLPLLIFVPLLYFSSKVICIMDNIIPVNFGVLYGWFLYLSVFGFVWNFIVMKKRQINLEEDGESKFLKKVLDYSLRIIIICCFVCVIFIGMIPKKDNFLDIRKFTEVNEEYFKKEYNLWKLMEQL